MRVFSGSRGALFLLGPPLAGGERPRSLLGVAERWRLRIDEDIVDHGVLSPEPDRSPVATVTGKTSATLDDMDWRADLPTAPDDEVLVGLGPLEFTATIPSALLRAAIERPTGTLTLNDLKEVAP